MIGSRNRKVKGSEYWVALIMYIRSTCTRQTIDMGGVVFIVVLVAR